MYRRPKFLEILHEIREEMSREADYDVDMFAEMVRREKDKKPKEKGKKEETFSIESVVDLHTIKSQRSKIKN